MKYALLLNDMRMANIENINIVKISSNKQDLIDWYRDQEADKNWKDGRWGKHFKKDSELEWFNQVFCFKKLNDYFGGIWEVGDGVEIGMGLSK